jgi:hypothetical protein
MVGTPDVAGCDNDAIAVVKRETVPAARPLRRRDSVEKQAVLRIQKRTLFWPLDPYAVRSEP